MIHFEPSHIAVSSPVLLLPNSAPRKFGLLCFVSTGPNSPVVISSPSSLYIAIPHPAGQFFSYFYNINYVLYKNT